MGRRKNEENNVMTGSSQGGTATMAPSRRADTKSQSTTAGPKITHDQIARRAHELWVKRGCKHGQDRENWFEAERQLKAELAGK